MSHKRCPTAEVSSFPSLPSESDVDIGAETRERVMALKDETAKRINKCRKEGTCPQYEDRPNDGPQQCVDGKTKLQA